MNPTRLPMTPLQRIVGFEVAEEIYDKLPLTSQVVLDLRMEGYTMQEIADTIGIPYTTVYDNFVRARFHLAKLKLTLETRQYYKETHPIVIDQTEFGYE